MNTAFQLAKVRNSLLNGLIVKQANSVYYQYIVGFPWKLMKSSFQQYVAGNIS
jgi:hypothetical protein